MGALCGMRGEKAPHFGHDPVERTGLVSVAALIVLPCIGSDTQPTPCPHARRRAAAAAACPRPFPPHPRDQCQAAGLVRRVQDIDQPEQVVWFIDGRIFSPIGFLMPRMNSTWALSGLRVRSPIHRKWAETSYQSPVVESIRVSACS